MRQIHGGFGQLENRSNLVCFVELRLSLSGGETEDGMVLGSPHRISRRRPLDRLRERLGFCDSPQGGSDWSIKRARAVPATYLVAAEQNEAALRRPSENHSAYLEMRSTLASSPIFCAQARGVAQSAPASVGSAPRSRYNRASSCLPHLTAQPSGVD